MSGHFHLRMRAIPKGKGRRRAAYILRLEGFKAREDLRGADHGNLPAWAEEDAVEFFAAADKYERRNGTVAKEITASVPRVLPFEVQMALIQEMRLYIASENHGFCYGFHVVKSSDGGTNDHVHFLHSERIDDGHRRSPRNYFARATPTSATGVKRGDPARGGCRKSRRFALFARGVASPELLKLRRWWAERCNFWLAEYGHEATLSERSYKAQGIDRVPGVHLYESAQQISKRGGYSHRVAANEAAKAANRLKEEAEGSGAAAPRPESPGFGRPGPVGSVTEAKVSELTDAARAAGELRAALVEAMEDLGEADRVRRKKPR